MHIYYIKNPHKYKIMITYAMTRIFNNTGFIAILNVLIIIQLCITVHKNLFI